MKTKTISIRVGLNEWEKFTTEAEIAGYSKASHFLRHHIENLKRSEKEFIERGPQLQLAELIRLRKLIGDCYSLLGRLHRERDQTDLPRMLDETLKRIDQWSEKFINP